MASKNGSHGDRSLRSLVDLEHGLVSREIYVNEDIYKQELEQAFARPGSSLVTRARWKSPGIA